ncbi:MAG: methyltransferase domain-containing protein [Gloeomargarita sp. SKYG116]|nr:methyltransferase domain-containing protein [Gloeomargarita sp. SKYG116]MDW8400470.1 methyltransferase domain-containing protein [Gloeomargarita sp. SKYGB_i_bin116]
MAKYLNCGCGNRYVVSDFWVNADLRTQSPDILAIDLREKLPFSDGMFDLVYHSHVLEHLTYTDAQKFLQECYRILKPNGIIRVVVPDLENIVREYIYLLEEIRQGCTDAFAKYDWIMLEMYDQVARHFSRGMMGNYLSKKNIPALDYVLERGGKEVENIIKSATASQNNPGSRDIHQLSTRPSPGKLVSSILSKLKKVPKILREKLISFLLGEEYSLLQVGRFRNSGEVHQWMYDSCSLERLLESVGFVQIKVQNPYQSYLENWCQFHLDTEPDGSIYKPNSLYMEARKP